MRFYWIYKKGKTIPNAFNILIVTSNSWLLKFNKVKVRFYLKGRKVSFKKFIDYKVVWYLPC